METIEDWANHIIKRFGILKAIDYAFSPIGSDCPCIYLRIECEDCKYSPKIDPHLVLCDAANDFIEIRNYSLFIIELKEEIKKCLNL